MHPMRSFVHAAALVALLASAVTARAGALQVSPVRVQFQADQRAQSLQVSTGGTDVLEAQVRILQWSQEDGQDRLQPADDIVVSPAILRVAPGQPQTVRLVRVSPTSPARELSYRVLVDELPSKATPTTATGLKVLKRYSIPVFVAPPGPSATPAKKAAAAAPPLTDLSHLRARLVPGTNGGTELQVRNEGDRHVRVSYLSASKPDGTRQSLGNGLIGYVLPGRQVSWPVDLPQPATASLTLKARFNDDREAQVLSLDGAGR